jgi:hypothetical protein
MRCKACNSPDAKLNRAWGEYYCEECSDSIYDSLEDFEELDEFDFLEDREDD